jgi:hypothetical protein
MKTLVMAALALVLATATGCVRYVEFYTVSFRSKGGSELARGTISLSSALPTSGTVLGWYKLDMRQVQPSSKEIELFYQVFKGKDSGRVEWDIPKNTGSAPAKFDFMPTTYDNNVIARGSQMARGYWKGIWSCVLFTGVYEGGVMEISRK